MDRGVLQATVRGVAKELDTTEVTEQQQQRRGRGAGGQDIPGVTGKFGLGV